MASPLTRRQPGPERSKRGSESIAQRILYVRRFDDETAKGVCEEPAGDEDHEGHCHEDCMKDEQVGERLVRRGIEDAA
ncbi:MAG: hypothetical protein IT462_18110 [Planctomycetes bacterium]|nr:hypothetical protein [Planctomycetota bacterium]